MLNAGSSNFDPCVHSFEVRLQPVLTSDRTIIYTIFYHSDYILFSGSVSFDYSLFINGDIIFIFDSVLQSLTSCRSLN
jgi:hypothetical protein